MSKENSNTLLWIVIVLSVLTLIFGFAGIFSSNTTVDLSSVNAKIDSSTASLKGDINAVKADIAILKTTSSSAEPVNVTVIDKEDVWKAEALELATDEWSAKGYKDIFDVLTNIDEKADIDSVVVKDDKVTKVDVDDKDAKVYQQLKVYYENLDGDRVKVYVDVTTIIKDGEVDDQEIVLA